MHLYRCFDRDKNYTAGKQIEKGNIQNFINNVGHILF